MKRYKFGTFQLDLNLKSLRTQDGQPVELTPKAMAVLTYLIENRDRVVSKDELLARLWPGTSVNDSNVHVNISNIREALERHGGKNFIRTVSTQGYHFAESVEECLGGSEPPAAEAAEPLGPVADLGSRPSRRLWVGVSAAAIVLVLMIVGLGINRHWRYVHSPRYFAAMFLTNAIDAHNSGHDQESIELARKAFTADPSLIRAYLLAAWWESLNEVDDRTIQTDAILDQLKAKNAALSQSEIQMEEGIRFDSHSDFSEAARSFREATVQSPEDADAWRMYGYELDNNELNFDSAATAFRKCLSIEPHDTDCVVGLLQSQNSLSQFDRSIEFFNSLPENLKQTPWVSEEFGYAQLGQKSYNEAMAAFERENRLGQSADEPSAINGSIEGRIQTRLLAGDNPTIVASYVEDEIQKFGGPPLQRANLELDLAAVDATSGREDDGIKHIRNALSISDQWHPELNISLMNTYHAEELLALCHAFDEATQVADSRHVNDDRDLAAAKFFIEGMRDLASPSSTQGAVRAFEQAYDTSPKPLYDFYRGKALLSIGHASEAKQAFQRFLDRRGDFQEDYIGLALLIPRAEKELATIDK